jgi:molecular chaperone GrpE
MKDVKKDVKEQELDETLEEILEAESSEEESAEAETPEASEVVEEETNDMATQLQKELDEYRNKYLRLNADFQNFRKRSEKEKTDLYKYANEKLIVELLPLVDNMERALDHIDEENKSSIVDGLKMIHKGFLDTLTKNGVEPIVAVGEEFDPQIHNAVMMEESEEHDSNIIIDEFQKGYRLKEKVIRHSMVKVSQ